MYGNEYRLKSEDTLARFVCEDHGYDLEIWPAGPNGQFRVGVIKDGELLTIRKLVYNYDQKRYALYETYRALANKIVHGKRKENL